MAARERVIGPTSLRVAANLKRIRQQRGLTLRELSRRLEDLGQPILDTGLIRAEAGDRPVNADELVALAVVLGVAPYVLLLPEAGMAVPYDETFELTPDHPLLSRLAWAWATGELPLSGDKPRDVAEFMAASKPHRFGLLNMGPIDKAQAAVTLRGSMQGLIADALRAGVDVDVIRSTFEQVLLICLNSMTGWVEADGAR